MPETGRIRGGGRVFSSFIHLFIHSMDILLPVRHCARSEGFKDDQKQTQPLLSRAYSVDGIKNKPKSNFKKYKFTLPHINPYSLLKRKMEKDEEENKIPFSFESRYYSKALSAFSNLIFTTNLLFALFFIDDELRHSKV